MSLRILHILGSPHLGGAETMCLNLAHARLQKGRETAVFALTKGKSTEFSQSLNIPVFLYDGDQTAVVGKREFRTRVSLQLLSTIRSFAPDIVHSHVPISNLICNRILSSRVVPWVTTIHGSWRQFAYAPETVAKPYLKPYLLLRHAVGDYWTTRSAARIVAIADYVRAELVRIGIPANKIVRIHNGLPQETTAVSRDKARRQFGIAADEIAIGSIGYFSPAKGFDLLIRAFKEIEKNKQFASRLRLLIVGGDIMGDGTVRQQLLKLANGNSRVNLLDSVGPLRDFISALDLFAVPSRTEGFSLVLVSAMQQAKPSVVTSAGGCIEAARPGTESLAFRSGSVSSLASSLKRMISDPALRERLGTAAAMRAHEYLTLERCVDEYEEMYESVVANIPRPDLPYSA